MRLKGLYLQLYKMLLLYPTPVNLNYMWNFGSLAMYALMIQIVTGVLLAFWYIPTTELAFWSVEFIMREVNYGWLIRYLHANGASFFFFVVYLHMSRGVYYSSYVYPREHVWLSGSIIFVLMIATAFFGYVLPWGQMSYWAATVISTLISTVPVIGQNLLIFSWGGISIDQPTLTRIYGLHFLLPWVILGLVGIHLVLLHEYGSNNPIGVRLHDNVPFHPYYTYKDITGIIVATFFYLVVVFFLPNYTIHSDNYIMANSEVTPVHIVPEWYFLLFYGILRSVPNKIGGVCLLAGSLFALICLPFISYPLIRSGTFRPVFQPLFWCFGVVCIVLGWSGGNPVTSPYYEICQICALLYFMFFFIFLPLTNFFEFLVYAGYSKRNYLRNIY